jgi:hypothetical protein
MSTPTLDFKGIWLTNIEELIVNIEGFDSKYNIWFGHTLDTNKQVMVNLKGYGKFEGKELILTERPRYPHPLARSYQGIILKT